MTELNHSRQPTIQTLPAEILFKILSYLNANCLSLAGAVCREWNALGNEDLLWKELCRARWQTLRHLPFSLHPRVDYSDPKLASALTVSEMKGILSRRGVPWPRGAVERSDVVKMLGTTRPGGSPSGRWSGKWKSSYVVAELDLKRTRLTFQDITSMEWKFEFAAGTAWNLSAPQTAAQARAQFKPDGTYVNPMLDVEGFRWRMTSYGGVQVEEYPPHRVQRTKDGGWVLSNGYFCYRSIWNETAAE